VLAANSGASIVLQVYNRDDILVGTFTVQIPQASTLLSACSWSGAGWSSSYYGAEVVSISNGPVYAGPMATGVAVTSNTGLQLSANFDMGRFPIASNVEAG